MATFFIVWLIAVVFLIVIYWRIFTKAGVAGWKSLIPVYSSYLFYKIGWGNGWMFLCVLIPVIGFIFPLILNIKIARAFGKDIGFGIGLIFLPIIFLPLLAFGNNQYIGPQNI
jgi:hypothetical protein